MLQLLYDDHTNRMIYTHTNYIIIVRNISRGYFSLIGDSLLHFIIQLCGYILPSVNLCTIMIIIIITCSSHKILHRNGNT